MPSHAAAGAVAIGTLTILALADKKGRIQRLDIEELAVGRLHVRGLVVERGKLLHIAQSPVAKPRGQKLDVGSTTEPQLA